MKEIFLFIILFFVVDLYGQGDFYLSKIQQNKNKHKDSSVEEDLPLGKKGFTSFSLYGQSGSLYHRSGFGYTSSPFTAVYAHDTLHCYVEGNCDPISFKIISSRGKKWIMQLIPADEESKIKHIFYYKLNT